MDGDGDLDAVTARFHNSMTNFKSKPSVSFAINFKNDLIFTAVEEQNFVWMENPGQAISGINAYYAMKRLTKC